MSTSRGSSNEELVTEAALLKKYAVRWAILAAWYDDLGHRKATVPERCASGLSESRIKIASGCFSACSVGCVLSEVEGDLVSADASIDESEANTWIDLLGKVMSESDSDIEYVLGLAPVRFRLSECGLMGSCACDDSEK
jgi:hypothetical protein